MQSVKCSTWYHILHMTDIKIRKRSYYLLLIQQSPTNADNSSSGFTADIYYLVVMVKDFESPRCGFVASFLRLLLCVRLINITPRVGS